MTRLEFAALLIKVEGHINLARAANLIGKDDNCVSHLKIIKMEIDYIFSSIIDPGSTKIYLAK